MPLRFNQGGHSLTTSEMFMHDATVQSKLREVDITRNGDIHVSIEPNKPGLLVDSHGEAVSASKTGLMKVDEKMSEPLGMSRGLAAIFSVALAIVSAVIGIWLYSLTGAMSYQTVVSRVGTVETRLDKVEKALDDVQGMKITLNNVQNDSKAIRDKQAMDEQDRKDLIKNIGDIRILLAQKGLQ